MSDTLEEHQDSQHQKSQHHKPCFVDGLDGKEGEIVSLVLRTWMKHPLDMALGLKN